jgi:hypothetical protein
LPAKLNAPEIVGSDIPKSDFPGNVSLIAGVHPKAAALADWLL